MIKKTTKFQLVFVCFLVFGLASCNPSPLTEEPTLEEPTLTPAVIAKPSPSPHITVESTPNNLAKEPTRQLQPTVQILQEPVIAPTVDINTTNINLKQELYFIGGAEQGGMVSSLPPCVASLFYKYGVSTASEQKFVESGTVPVELKSISIPPYFWTGALNKHIDMCIYGFPEDETVIVELYTPEGDFCTSWDVRVSDYYYLAVGAITVVNFAADRPSCSLAGQWSVIVKSANAKLTQPLEVNWYDTFDLSASDLCGSSNEYISVKGSGYPPGESRFLGIYGAHTSDECEWEGQQRICKLLQSYLVKIDDSGEFDILLPVSHQASYIAVPVIADDPPGGELILGYLPGIVDYPETTCYIRDLYLTAPTLKGKDVKEVQWKLRRLGYFEVGSVDGDFGTKTDAAVRLFQQTNALDPNGTVDETTRKALFGEDAIPRPLERNLYVTSPRLNGDDVVIVQQRLTDLGYREVGEVDGYYGPMTESGVLRFQKMTKLPESGIVDEQTWNSIFGGSPVPGW